MLSKPIVWYKVSESVPDKTAIYQIETDNVVFFLMHPSCFPAFKATVERQGAEVEFRELSEWYGDYIKPGTPVIPLGDDDARNDD